MGFKIRKNGAWADPSRAPMRRAGNGWVPVQTIYQRSGNAWVAVWSALSLNGTPKATGRYNCKGASCPTNVIVIAQLTSALSVSGGVGNLSISWALVSGTPFTVTGGNTLSPSFQVSIGREGAASATYRCTVTDGVSTVFYDMNVSVDYQWTDPR